MVTLKDIAQEAGVSVMTVSRVVNHKYSEVSDENITRIKAIIERLGYVPDSSARSLSSKASKIVSIIVQGDTKSPCSAYTTSMLTALVQGIQARGYHAMPHFIENYSDVATYLRTWKAEGAVFLGTFDENIRQIQTDNPIPLVFTDSYSSVRQISNVGIDDYKGGVLAAEYFLKHGHRDIAFMSPYLKESQLNQQRFEGFSDTLRRAGYPLTPDRIFDMEYNQNFEQSVDTLCHLTQPVTAIFAASDDCAVDLLRLLKKKGYRIPEDYSIIGFDNLPVCQYTTPALTTIAQNIWQKAQYALDTLFNHLKDSSLPTQSLVLNVELIERESVYQIEVP